MDRTKFTLVLATVSRTTELDRLLRALKAQTYQGSSVILVDQNQDNRLDPILALYNGSLSIQRLRSTRGLSRARNVALPQITGDIVGFPDDDCWYPPDLLARVAGFFSEHPECGGLTGRHCLPDGVLSPGWDRQAGWLTKRNVWKRAISFTIFLRRTIVEAVGRFDEGLGAGTAGGEGEETDFLLSALEQGFRIYYNPNLFVFHANLRKFDGAARRKQYTDAMGLGRVLRKHRYPVPLVSYFFIRPLAGIVLKLVTGRTKEALRQWAMFRGRLVGYASTFK